jgi:hypothetical protein
MNRDYLKNITPEQREEMRLKAVQTRLNRVAYANDNLKLDYTDMSQWEEMAREAGVRLPNTTSPNTDTKFIKRVANKIGVDMPEFLESCGVKTIKELCDLNPTWTARAMCGLVLEYSAYKLC